MTRSPPIVQRQPLQSTRKQFLSTLVTSCTNSVFVKTLVETGYKFMKKITMESASERERPEIDFEKENGEGHLTLQSQSLLQNRYEVQSVIGCGSFGQVWAVRDLKFDQRHAMKVSIRTPRRAIPAHCSNKENNQNPDAALVELKTKKKTSTLKFARKEIDILKELNALDGENKGLIVQLFDYFEVGNRSFIIMELLDMNLYEFLEISDFQPFPNDHALHISYQILLAMDFLHSNNYMHTDIKPDNVVLVHGEYEEIPNPLANQEIEKEEGCSPSRKRRHQSSTLKVLIRTQIRLVDFGSALSLKGMLKAQQKGKIGTREYRPPESILGLKFDTSADIWAVGCTLFEIWKGFTLFEGPKCDDRSLHRMETVLGPMPKRLLHVAPIKFMCGRDAMKRLRDDREKKDLDHFNPPPTLLMNYFDTSNEIQVEVFELIRKLIEFEALSRLTADKALEHELFNKFLPVHLKHGKP